MRPNLKLKSNYKNMDANGDIRGEIKRIGTPRVESKEAREEEYL